MTPKEKALKLCQEFGLLGMNWEQTTFNSLDLNNAKECTNICINEILDSFDSVLDARIEFRHALEVDAVRYWNEVKQEIEKL